MRRILIILFLVIIIIGVIIIYILQNKEKVEVADNVNNIISNNQENTIVGHKDIRELPKNYGFDDAIKDNCFVAIHNERYNNDILDKFISDIINKRPSFIRIVQCTTEGDLIITDIDYKQDGQVEMCEDTTRDGYGSQGYKDYTFKYIGILDDWLTAYDKLPITDKMYATEEIFDILPVGDALKNYLTKTAFNYLPDETKKLVTNPSSPTITNLKIETDSYSYVDINGKMKSLKKGKEIILVDFTKNISVIPNNVMVIFDADTKEALGFGLVD
ncbi:MAG: DUF4362 domain-containing protein [Oscillospiraceae bacterium]|nr:DUF4362 domain-containing protein [Oscillospiraceae bacterium]